MQSRIPNLLEPIPDKFNAAPDDAELPKEATIPIKKYATYHFSTVPVVTDELAEKALTYLQARRFPMTDVLPSQRKIIMDAAEIIKQGGKSVDEVVIQLESVLKELGIRAQRADQAQFYITISATLVLGILGAARRFYFADKSTNGIDFTVFIIGLGLAFAGTIISRQVRNKASFFYNSALEQLKIFGPFGTRAIPAPNRNRDLLPTSVIIPTKHLTLYHPRTAIVIPDEIAQDATTLVDIYDRFPPSIYNDPTTLPGQTVQRIRNQNNADIIEEAVKSMLQGAGNVNALRAELKSVGKELFVRAERADGAELYTSATATLTLGILAAIKQFFFTDQPTDNIDFTILVIGLSFAFIGSLISRQVRNKATFFQAVAKEELAKLEPQQERPYFGV